MREEQKNGQEKRPPEELLSSGHYSAGNLKPKKAFGK